MFETAAAFDIGSSKISLVIAKKSFKTINVENPVFEDIDPTMPSHEEGVKKALRKLIDRHPVGGCRILVNFPLEKTIIRSLSLPFSDPDQIKSAVPYEALENIPVDMDKLVLSYQITSHNSSSAFDIGDHGQASGKNGNSVNLIASAAQKEDIDNFIAVMQSCGVEPNFIGSEINSYYECYNNSKAASEENTLFVNIGHSKTIIMVLLNGQLSNVRCIPAGCSSIIGEINKTVKDPLASYHIFQSYAGRNDSSGKKNETAKLRKTGLTAVKLKKINDTTDKLLSDICSQIKITMQSYKQNNIGFKKLIISGGGAAISGINELFHEETGIRTHIEYDIVPAVGSVLSYFNYAEERMNFPVNSEKNIDSSAIFKKYRLAVFFFSAAFIILAVNLIIGLIFSSFEQSGYDSTIESLFKRTFQARTINGDPVEEAEKIVNQERKDSKSLFDVIPPNAPILANLADVTSQFSSDSSFSVRNFYMDREFIRIDGDIDAAAKIDSLKNKLIESKRFESVSVNSSTQGKIVTFSMTIKIKRTTFAPKGDTK